MIYPIANSKTKVLAQEYVRKWKWVARKPRPSVSSSFQTLKLIASRPVSICVNQEGN